MFIFLLTADFIPLHLLASLKTRNRSKGQAEGQEGFRVHPAVEARGAVLGRQMGIRGTPVEGKMVYGAVYREIARRLPRGQGGEWVYLDGACSRELRRGSISGVHRAQVRGSPAQGSG